MNPSKGERASDLAFGVYILGPAEKALSHTARAVEQLTSVGALESSAVRINPIQSGADVAEILDDYQGFFSDWRERTIGLLVIALPPCAQVSLAPLEPLELFDGIDLAALPAPIAITRALYAGRAPILPALCILRDGNLHDHSTNLQLAELARRQVDPDPLWSLRRMRPGPDGATPVRYPAPPPGFEAWRPFRTNFSL